MHVRVSLTTAGCPIRSHFEQAVAENVGALGGRDRRERRLRRAQRRREEHAPAAPRPRGPAPGRARPGQERDLRRLRQGRCGQVHRDRQPGLRATGRGQAVRRHGRRRLGLLDPAHAGRARTAHGVGRAQDHPAGGPGRRGRHLDRVLPRDAGPGHHLARADAPQGDPPVPRGRGLGRARLPADRPAARHRRRVDDAGAAASPGAVRDRDHPAAGRAEGGQARRRHRAALRPRDHRRDREHERASPPRPASASPSSARAAARSWPTSWTCRCWARCRSRRSCGWLPTRAGRWCSRTRTRRPPRRCATRRAASSPPRRSSWPCLQEPSGPPLAGVPEVTGTALPMAQ